MVLGVRYFSQLETPWTSRLLIQEYIISACFESDLSAVMAFAENLSDGVLGLKLRGEKFFTQVF